MDKKAISAAIVLRQEHKGHQVRDAFTATSARSLAIQPINAALEHLDAGATSAAELAILRTDADLLAQPASVTTADDMDTTLTSADHPRTKLLVDTQTYTMGARGEEPPIWTSVLTTSKVAM